MPYAASPRGGKAVRTLAQKDVGTRKAQGETPLGGRVGATPSPRDPHRAATAVKATAGETRGPRSARSPRVGAQAVQDHERVRWAAWEAPASAKHSGTARPHPDANGANAPGLAGQSRAPRPGLPGPTDTGPVNRGRAGDRSDLTYYTLGKAEAKPNPHVAAGARRPREGACCSVQGGGVRVTGCRAPRPAPLGSLIPAGHIELMGVPGPALKGGGGFRRGRMQRTKKVGWKR